MYELCITCARILWNVDKDVFDLLIYAGICWSASTSTCLYVFSLLVFALSLLSCRTERSEAERGRSLLHYFPGVGASVAKQNEAALNYMLESVRKFVSSVIRAPQHIIN